MKSSQMLSKPSQPVSSAKAKGEFFVLKGIHANCKSWILDGYPNTENQALLLDKFGVKPHIVVHVSISKSEAIARAQKEREQNQQ